MCVHTHTCMYTASNLCWCPVLMSIIKWHLHTEGLLHEAPPAPPCPVSQSSINMADSTIYPIHLQVWKDCFTFLFYFLHIGPFSLYHRCLHPSHGTFFFISLTFTCFTLDISLYYRCLLPSHGAFLYITGIYFLYMGPFLLSPTNLNCVTFTLDLFLYITDVS